MRYWPSLFQSRWLDISRVLFCVLMRKKKQTNKGTRPISRHLDRTSLVKKDFLCRKKITLYWVRVKNYFFTSRAAGRKSNLFVAHETHESSYVFFVLTVFCHFLRLRHRHCPKITNLVGLHHEIFSKAHLAYSLTLVDKANERIRTAVRLINSLNLECDHKDKPFLWGTLH